MSTLVRQAERDQPHTPPHPLDRKVKKEVRHGKKREKEGEHGCSNDETDRGTRGKLIFSKGAPIFDETRSLFPNTWRGRVEKEIRALFPELDVETRERLHNRLREFDRCGYVVRVRACGCCGTERDGSGSFAGTRRTCKLTVCPTCGWVRAKKVSEFYLRASEVITAAPDAAPDYRWQLLTLTTRYRPDLEEDVTWQALRIRARLVAKAATKLWQKALKVSGGAMFRSTECSVRGHVHAHLLYFGPDVDESALSDLAQKLCGDGIGYIHKRPIEGGDGKGNQFPFEVARAARYMAKGTSGYGAEFNEGYHGYDSNNINEVKTMHPKLAARWEVATQRIHMVQKYGAFRGLDYCRSDYRYEPPDDSKTACESCGKVGEWCDKFRKSEVWMQECHDRGRKAMDGGSQWVPWWKKMKMRELIEGW
jgi:hypothetical protein